MSPLWLKRTDDDGSARGERKKRRSGRERRGPGDRREPDRRDGGRRRTTSELYQSDLDRHLWSWASSKAAKRRRKERTKRKRRRRVAGVVASAAGALSAAGLSYFLYRRLREDELPEDPDAGQADLDEADFDDQ